MQLRVEMTHRNAVKKRERKVEKLLGKGEWRGGGGGMGGV